MVEPHEPSFLRFEPVEQRRDLLAVINPRGSGWSGNAAANVRHGRTERIEVAHKVSHGDTTGNDRQVARKTRATDEPAKHRRIISHAFEDDLCHDILALRRGKGGLSSVRYPASHVGEEAAKPIDERLPGTRLASEAAIQES